MRNSAIIGIGAYLTVVVGVLGGAYATFEAVIGPASVQAGPAVVVKQAPGARTSGKWTPVEIKREAELQPPLPPYVIPSQAARARVAKTTQKRVVVARRAAPDYQQRHYEQRNYDQRMAAYAPIEPPRMFGPFRFGF